jgi:hypothetical protein
MKRLRVVIEYDVPNHVTHAAEKERVLAAAKVFIAFRLGEGHLSVTKIETVKP